MDQDLQKIEALAKNPQHQFDAVSQYSDLKGVTYTVAKAAVEHFAKEGSWPTSSPPTPVKTDEDRARDQAQKRKQRQQLRMAMLLKGIGLIVVAYALYNL